MQRTYHLDAIGAGKAKAMALAMLVGAGTIRSFADGEFIQHEGDVSDGIWIVVDGMVVIGNHSADGSFNAVGVGGVGDITGERAYFARVPRQADAIANGPTSIAFVNGPRLDRLIDEVPGVARLLLYSMARQMQVLGALLDAERTQPARVRLARLLLAQTTPAQLDMVASQQDVANLLGVSRVTLVSALTDLVASGLVARSYRRISVVDRRGLETWVATRKNRP